MKKIRVILPAFALGLAVAGAVGFRSDTEVFKLDPNTGSLQVPYEIVTTQSYICNPERSDLYCTQEWEVDPSGQPVQPANIPEMGQFELQ